MIICFQKAWEEERQEKLEKLEDLYERNLKQVGGAHVSAVEQVLKINWTCSLTSACLGLTWYFKH